MLALENNQSSTVGAVTANASGHNVLDVLYLKPDLAYGCLRTNRADRPEKSVVVLDARNVGELVLGFVPYRYVIVEWSCLWGGAKETIRSFPSSRQENKTPSSARQLDAPAVCANDPAAEAGHQKRTASQTRSLLKDLNRLVKVVTTVAIRRCVLVDYGCDGINIQVRTAMVRKRGQPMLDPEAHGRPNAVGEARHLVRIRHKVGVDGTVDVSIGRCQRRIIRPARNLNEAAAAKQKTVAAGNVSISDPVRVGLVADHRLVGRRDLLRSRISRIPILYRFIRMVPVVAEDAQRLGL